MGGLGGAMASSYHVFRVSVWWCALCLASIGYAQNSILWQSTFNGGGPPGVLSDVSLVTSTGDVFVAGREFGFETNRIHLQRIRAGGSSMWTQTHTVAGGTVRVPVKACLFSGGIAITYTLQTPSDSNDVRIAWFNGLGQLVWEITFDGPSGLRDSAHGIGARGSSLYVTGVCGRQSGNFVLTDPFLNKYDATGALQWSTVQAGNTNTIFCRGPVFDSSGNIIILRRGFGVLKKFDPQGAEVWSVDLPTGIDNLHAAGPEVDPVVGVNDRIVVAGAFLKTDASDIDPMVLSYDTNGNLEWKHTFDTGTPSQSRVLDAVISESGAVYIGLSIASQNDITAATGRIQKLEKDGQVSLDFTLDLPILQLEVDRAANIYSVTFDGTQTFPERLRIRKHNPQGTQMWAQTLFAPTDEALTGRTLMHKGADASLYISFSSSRSSSVTSPHHWKVVRMAPSRFFAKQIVVGTNGRARVLWERFDGRQFFIQKLSGIGEVTDSRVFDTPANFALKAFAIGRANSMIGVLFAGTGAFAGRVRIIPIRDNLTVQQPSFTSTDVSGTATSIAIDSADRVWFSTPFTRFVQSGGPLQVMRSDIVVRKVNVGFDGIERTVTCFTTLGLATSPSISAGNDNRLRVLVGTSVTGGFRTRIVTLNAGGTAASQTFVVADSPISFGKAVATGTDNRSRVALQFVPSAQDASAASVVQVEAAGDSRFGEFVTERVIAGNPISVAMSLANGSTRGMILFPIEGGAARVLVFDFATQTRLATFDFAQVFAP
jgi:outer membrane protein assembly factor BamB